jgi:hypothetical protein
MKTTGQGHSPAPTSPFIPPAGITTPALAEALPIANRENLSSHRTIGFSC